LLNFAQSGHTGHSSFTQKLVTINRTFLSPFKHLIRQRFFSSYFSERVFSWKCFRAAAKAFQLDWPKKKVDLIERPFHFKPFLIKSSSVVKLSAIGPLSSMVARWHIFKPKNTNLGAFWKALGCKNFGIFTVILVTAILYFCIDILFHILVCCTKKNLATLLSSRSKATLMRQRTRMEKNPEIQKEEMKKIKI
jgi:hypothetical protein